MPEKSLVRALVLGAPHADPAAVRYLRPSFLLIAGGALLATLPLFLFPGAEVRLVACAVVVALTTVLHRAVTTGVTRSDRWRHEGRTDALDVHPVAVRVDDTR